MRQKVSFIKSPGDTVMFQLQVPFPGYEGYSGVEKFLPSPAMCTTDFLSTIHSPVEAKSTKENSLMFKVPLYGDYSLTAFSFIPKSTSSDAIWTSIARHLLYLALTYIYS